MNLLEGNIIKGETVVVDELSYSTLYIKRLAKRCRSLTSSNISASLSGQKDKPSCNTVSWSDDKGYLERLMILLVSRPIPAWGLVLALLILVVRYVWPKWTSCLSQRWAQSVGLLWCLSPKGLNLVKVDGLLGVQGLI